MAPGVDTGTAAADEVGLLPGEREHDTAVERASTGISLDEGAAATLVDSAEEMGLTGELPDGLR